ncbi:hypothetical protein BGW37DRAFT_478925 [Umbelopsis sp. PMI_123]|nr:hypothetical protein BGW37DRAFT_478925 [Umbelopsis sp. PMI_123]
MKFSLSAILAVACATAASATTINVITPWSSTTWTAGGAGSITWNVTTAGSPAFTLCSIDMLDGSATNANVVAHVTSVPIDCSLGKFEITPLANFASGKYWLRIGSDPTWFYSGQFTFQGTGSVGALSSAWNASASVAPATASISMASGSIPTASGSALSANASASASASAKVTSGSAKMQTPVVAITILGAAVAALM